MSTNTYYTTCAFPKPVTKKKKPACNGYKDKQNRICAYTGERGAERHELFGGANRQTSIREGLQIDLSPDKHRELQDNITPWAQAENRRLKADAQKKWMDRYMETENADEAQALRAWMLLIGRNYREDVMPE